MSSFPHPRKLFSLLLLLLIVACSRNNTVKIPAGIVPPDSMVQVLTDVHILQASFQLGYGQNIDGSSTENAFKNLCKKHRLTDSSYNNCLQFYSKHPKLLDSIYDKVLNNLSRQKAEAMGKK